MVEVYYSSCYSECIHHCCGQDRISSVMGVNSSQCNDIVQLALQIHMVR